MAIPGSGSFTDGTVRTEWSLSLPLTSAQLASAAGLSSAYGSEDLRGLSAFDVDFTFTSITGYDFASGSFYAGSHDITGTVTPTSGVTTSYLSLVSNPPVSLTSPSAVPSVLASGSTATITIGLSGNMPFEGYSGTWTGSFTARFTHSGTNIDIPVTFSVDIGGIS